MLMIMVWDKICARMCEAGQFSFESTETEAPLTCWFTAKAVLQSGTRSVWGRQDHSRWVTS